ncbi:MAG: glycoside-pentoside-hexuronide (GPH):cation symporter [Oscillospiraceae bacterium]|jgi:GPH family glycoside/pentoside/hexuronide:cation symporter|nr:glycoside-pentoside-hexuronide (GPH):cation symporter [Oscillospiraceae bacterium]
MEDKRKYLNIWHKMAYGSGDMATNFCYSFLSSFILIYFTDTMGLNAGVIGTLFMLSRVIDGVSDVIAGVLIDRTKSRWGKARPWMLLSILPIAVCEILIFSVPDMGRTLQYAYIFVIYTLLNAVFYTANNVAYSTLAMLITPKKTERVQLGVFRFVFTLIATMIVSGGTMEIVKAFGGGVNGWRYTAILFAALFVLFQALCVFPLRELPPSELGGEVSGENVSFVKSAKYLLHNRFFVIQLFVGILYMGLVTITSTVGVYYMTYIIKNPSMLAAFSLAMALPMVVGLFATPALVKRFNIWKTVVAALVLSTAMCIPYMIFGFKGMVIPMLVFQALHWLFRGPQTGVGAALTAEVCGYTLHKDGVRIEGTINSCGTMGQKVGMGIGTAVTGWLMAASGYNGNLEVQPESALSMISFLYAALPLIITAIVAVLMYFMNVEKANAQLDAQKGAY